MSGAHLGAAPTRGSAYAAVVAVLCVAVPALLIRAGVLVVGIELGTLLFGLSVVAAAFAMSWAAEAAERDIPRALSLIIVALLAVLPEYAVDNVFAWKAGQDPAFAAFAAANMTGSNRLLLGLGWPTVAVIAWLSRRGTIVSLDRGAAVALAFLGIATLYSFSLPLRGAISLLDSLLLGSLFVAYAVWAARSGTAEPELVGPAAAIGTLPDLPRRAVVLGLFAFAGVAIAVAAEPFADGLVRTGARLGIDQFLLVQWLAPLASESPEFLVAALLTLRGKAPVALALLLSAQVNQWTLLVGSLAVSYSIGAGGPASLPLDGRQSAEVLLTAGQSLFGIAVLASLSFSLGEAALLSGLFATQFLLGGILRAAQRNGPGADLELHLFAVLYLILSAAWALGSRRVIWRAVRGPRSR